MKLLASFTCLVASASAFSPSSPRTAATTSSNSRLHMSDIVPDDVYARGYYTNLEARNEQMKSIELPGKEMGQLFDPFKFTETGSGLFFQREAEIKHCRLAMLAALGWPVAELMDGPLANLFGAPALLDGAARNPNILNGGLYKINPWYWVIILGVASVVDVYQISRANNMEANPDYIPGDLGFDPLGLYPKDKAGKLEMQAKEIRNGRLAMIAVSAFVAQEYVQQSGIVEHSSFFFKPFFM